MLKMLETSPSHQNALRVRLTAGQKVSKKYRKQLWKRECKNLKAIVPSIANKNVSEVEVIEEAVGYIEQLHQAIADRLGVLPCDQMIAALHRMAQLKQAAQANARLPPTPAAFHQARSSTFQQGFMSQLEVQRTAQSSQHYSKTMTPVRL